MKNDKNTPVGFACMGALDNCKNLTSSYGMICVRCNKCGRFIEKEKKENKNA